MEAPGLSSVLGAAASAAFSDFKTRIDGCANGYALRQLAPQITASSKKLTEDEILRLSKHYNHRSKELAASQDSLRVISGPGAGDYVSIERGLEDGDLRKPALWDRMFNRPDYAELLKTEGLAGQLREGNCRSVAWKLYLDVLPTQKSKWAESAAKSRSAYADAVKKYILDPTTISADDDLAKNNPLAVDDDAPWQQHFQDEEYRKDIQQDINRTFPEVEFFRLAHVQEDMLNILFCYARMYPDLGYRQGMHELLAGVYYTVYLDQADPADKQTAEFTDLMLTVLDPAHVAADSFSMFCELMEVASSWFAQNQHVPKPKKAFTSSSNALFRDSRAEEASSAILVQMNRIHDQLLKKFDSELYHRLQVLDIPPQIYGLRWIRVLFAREFTLPNTFKVWDAIFADSSTLRLTDYIFVAMLCFYRDKYLSSDHTTVLKLLMSPLEDVGDIQYIIELALHIREPRVFPRPAVSDSSNKIDMTPPSPPRQSKPKKSLTGWMSNSSVAPKVHSAAAPKAQSAAPSAAAPDVRLPSPPLAVPPAVAAAATAVRQRVPSTSPPSSGADGPVSVSPPTHLLRANDALQQKVQGLKNANRVFGAKLQLHLDQLQDELLVTDRLPNDDVIYLALAGMKEVKDVLQGRISPTSMLKR